MLSSDFHWPVRVYYEDTDAAGVVYYANYLKYLERARTECLRSRGFEQSTLSRDIGVVFVVRSIAVDYLRPARFDDELSVVTQIARIGRASLAFEQQVLRLDRAANDALPVPELLTRASVKVACLDARAFTPTALPAALLKELRSER